MQIKKLAVAAGAVGALALSLVTAAPASADYSPGAGDVVGVGSDTVQYAIDFLADGDYVADPGYNAGNRNKVVNFDATPDANARLAYGSNGLGTGATAALNACTPGTGGSQGTGNQNTTHTGDKPCTLNPTIVLRAGQRPVLRPNGSGAGYNALKADDVAGSHNIDFARASSGRGANALYDSVIIGTDGLAMLASTTTNSVPLTAAQLTSVYNCTTTNWSAFGGAAGTIVPILPQVGSGTRSSFLAAISLTEATIGSCTVNAEENDPEAIDASSSPANAIEPMSSGRLNMYKGLASDGVTSLGTGYFTDPSCVYASTTAPACTTGKTLNPNVQYYTSAGALNVSRNMYIYFRDSDISTTKAFQPGGARNFVRTLFYNPCSGTNLAGLPISNVAGTPAAQKCTSGGLYGPGGAPEVVTTSGLAQISASGIVPTGYAFNLGS